MALPFPALVPLVLAKLRAALNCRVPMHAASDYSRLSVGTCVFRVLTLLSVPSLAEEDDIESPPMHTLVVAEYIPYQTAQKLRQQGQYYADAMGNAWLETESPNLTLLLCGNRGRRLTVRQGTAFEPYGLRLLLQLLTAPTLLRCSDEELAKRFHLAPERVANMLLDLAEQGFLHTIGDARMLLRQPALALAWIQAYGSVLRPQLPTCRYRWLPSVVTKLTWLEVARKTACSLGGVVAARHLLNCSLITESITLYAKSVNTHSLLHRIGLVVDPSGPVELVQFFAAPNLLAREHCVHPLVICADLLRYDSEESHRVRQLLLKQYLPHLSD